MMKGFENNVGNNFLQYFIVVLAAVCVHIYIIRIPLKSVLLEDLGQHLLYISYDLMQASGSAGLVCVS